MGSPQAGTVYQYRIVLPYDDRVLNVATDADFNVEGDAKLSLSPTLSLKSTFAVSRSSQALLG